MDDAWTKQVRDELVPKIRGSDFVASLFTGGEADIKFAVETGLSILLDKPIIVVVPPGVALPDKLVRVADRIVEADVDSFELTAERISDAMDELAQEGR